MNLITDLFWIFDTAPSPEIYYKFADWLQLEDVFKSVWMSFLGLLVKGIYNLTHGIEEAFNFVFKLTGFTTYSQLSNLQKFFVSIGLAMLAGTICLFALEMITGRRLQIHTMLINIAVVLGVVIVLPQAMGILNSFTNSATQEVSNLKVANGPNGNAENTTNQSTNSMALQVIRNNVVDVGTLARNGFKKTPNDLIKEGKALNGITDQNVNGLDFGTMIKSGSSDKSGNKTGDYSQIPVETGGVNAGDVLLYGLNSNPTSENSWKNDVQMVTSSHWVFKNADTGYQRYRFMVLPILTQSIVLIALFILSGIKIVKLIFELAIMRVLAVLTAFSSLKSSAKIKELVSTVFWSYMAIIMQLAMIKIFMIFINYGSAQTLGSNLNLAEKGFVVIILYIGAFYGVFAGSGYINRLSGIESGTGNETQQLLGTMGAATMIGGGVKSISNGFGKSGNSSNSSNATPLASGDNPNLQGTSASDTSGIVESSANNSKDVSTHNSNSNDTAHNQDNQQNTTSQNDQSVRQSQDTSESNSSPQETSEGSQEEQVDSSNLQPETNQNGLDSAVENEPVDTADGDYSDSNAESNSNIDSSEQPVADNNQSEQANIGANNTYDTHKDTEQEQAKINNLTTDQTNATADSVDSNTNIEAGYNKPQPTDKSYSRAMQNFERSINTDPILNGKNPEDNVDDYL